MSEDERDVIDRRSFVQGIATAGAGMLAMGEVLAQTTAPGQPGGNAAPSPASGNTEGARVLTLERSGSDFMVDVLKALKLEYVACNPGSGFRGLHESIINYGKNADPELLTCTHEEVAVSMAHGYARIEGKPMAALMHGTVGLQHAAMALYNAWCDRVPVYTLVGNHLDAAQRRTSAQWLHSAQDPIGIVRDFLKWDDQPASLQHFADSAVRAYGIATSYPQAPVAISCGSEIQEMASRADARLTIPGVVRTAPPVGEPGAVAELARLLVRAESPVIVVDRMARCQESMGLLVKLAETLQAPVCELGSRLNFPTRHPLNQSMRLRALVRQADLILGLEVTDFWAVTNGITDDVSKLHRSYAREGLKRVSIGINHYYPKANYQDFQRYTDVDLDIPGDVTATLPFLIEAVQRELTGARRSALRDRGQRLAAAFRTAVEHGRQEARYAWNASPISTARLCSELWSLLQGEDWTLAGSIYAMSFWPLRLWDMHKVHNYVSDSGGYGVGFMAPAAVGMALANRKHGRLTVAIQPDGDFLFNPGAVWTAAHHRIPLLMIMHNNRAYHQEVMHVQRMANRHNRGIDRAHIGTALRDPDIDYARIAQGLGVHAEGPISEPDRLAPALKRAIATVKAGQPALVDVVMQPR